MIVFKSMHKGSRGSVPQQPCIAAGQRSGRYSLQASTPYCRLGNLGCHLLADCQRLDPLPCPMQLAQQPARLCTSHRSTAHSRPEESSFSLRVTPHRQATARHIAAQGTQVRETCISSLNVHPQRHRSGNKNLRPRFIALKNSN